LNKISNPHRDSIYHAIRNPENFDTQKEIGVNNMAKQVGK
jgi:hypothetical protein